MNVKDVANVSDLCYMIKYKVERYTDIKWLADKIRDSGVIVYNIDYAIMYDSIITKYLSKHPDKNTYHIIINENSSLFVDKIEAINFDISNIINVYVYKYIERDINGIIRIYVAIGDKYAGLN